MIHGKCIVCEGDKSGFPIIDDAVIRTIRAVKKKLNMAKGNTLIVCPTCVEPYKQKRSEFEKALVQYGLIGAFLLLLLAVVPLLIGGSFNLGSVATAALLALLIFAFSVFRYYPAADLAGYVPSTPQQAAQQMQATNLQAPSAQQPSVQQAQTQQPTPSLRTGLLSFLSVKKPAAPSKQYPSPKPAEKSHAHKAAKKKR